MPRSSPSSRRARAAAGAPDARSAHTGGRRVRTRRRFGAVALAAAASVALAGGAATGAVVHGATATTAVLDARDVARPAEPTPTASAPGPTVTPGGDRLTSRSRLVIPDAPDALEATEPLVLPAPPATAAPVDPLAVDAAGLTAADRAAGLLSTAVPDRATGALGVVPGGEPSPAPERPVRTVRVEVEVGLDVDPELFARTVMTVLNDPRGWGADGSISFARTDGPADLRVVLASPDLTDELCAPLDTVGRYSCGSGGAAVLNHLRWVQGGASFPDRTLYRQYLVNHEVGHLLGHRHERCPGAGRQAPLMQQQTETSAPCVANGWPFPG